MRNQWAAMIFLLFSLSLAACQPIQAMPEANATSSDSPLTSEEEANKAVVLRFYEEVVNQKNPALLAELFDPNIVAHELDFGEDGGNLEEVMTSMPDVQTTISLWVVKGDLVAAVVTFNGTHTGGDLLDVPATDKPVTFSIIDIWRVRDGKLTDLWHNVPNSDMLEQIQPTAAAVQ